jgi:uncharacterized SAM-binding protein YcdF (DUF218 family)
MKRSITFALIVSLLLLQFIAFRAFWLERIGAFLIYRDRLAPADAVLVLGGGGMDRVLQGIQLYKQHR